MNHWLFRRLAQIGVGALALAVIVLTAVSDWTGALIFAGFLALSAFFLWEKSLPAVLDFLFVTVAVVNAGGWVWDWYHVIYWYDEVAHAATTFVITSACSYRLYGSLFSSSAGNGLLFVPVTASFGVSIGALWEIAEWHLAVIGPLRDTISDLVFDTIGALAAGTAGFWILRRCRATSQRNAK